MLKNRSAGVLLHVTSLPSPYGTGVFGEDCKKFIKSIAQMGFHAWQVLPFNITDAANSPYCSPSAFAGNYLLINPQALFDSGLIPHDEVDKNICDASGYTAQFDFANTQRLSTLKLAFSNINSQIQEEINAFDKEQLWLDDFALFMAIKSVNDGKAWWQWDDGMSRYAQAIKNKSRYKNEVDFWKFTQYIFFKQWSEIKSFARENDVSIIGDMPFYVAMDSVDVWANVDLFLLENDSLLPKKVAGVPPDYFSQDGQLWGNPIYNWTAMEKDDFNWWIKRVGHSLLMFDTVRIDHFRAFASYWQVDATEKTAKNGQWKKGPGMKLWNEVNSAFKEPSIIAEDLGTFGEDVIELLEETKFPGMRVIQFAFDPNSDSTHLPHNYPKNCVAYVGTHDNNTILGWLWSANESERAFALDYCGFNGDNWGDGGYHSKSCRCVIETLWKSSANTVIIALQDMCGFGSDARMNIPGVPEQNWRYRATSDTIDNIDKEYFKKINTLYRR